MKAYTRHLLFCTGSDCDGKGLLREARKLLGRDGVFVKRSKVGCLGVCKHGPIVIVYPDGIWYRCPNKKVLRRIIDEHIKAGCPVEKYIVQRVQPMMKA